MYHLLCYPMYLWHLWLLFCPSFHTGGGQFGERNIADQADEFLGVAQGHQQNFKVPQILFIFTNGVTTPLRAFLTRLGIDVQGEEVPVDKDTQHKLELANESLCGSEDEDVSDSEQLPGEEEEEVVEVEGKKREKEERLGPALELIPREKGRDSAPSLEDRSLVHPGGALGVMDPVDQDEEVLPIQSHSDGANHVHDLLTALPEVNKINLDITSLISLVSNQCHGRCNFIFQEEVLTRQAAQERASPSLPKLRQYMAGKSFTTLNF